MQMSRGLVECLLRLRNDPEFAPFRDYLEERHQVARDNCEALDGAALHRAQGRAKEVRELKDLITEATELRERMGKKAI